MQASTEHPLDLALIGAGSVGTAVSELLRRAGHRIVGVSSRSTESARRASARLGAPVFDLAQGLPPRAAVLLIGVVDDAIGSVARAVAARDPAGLVLCHFAGALGLGPLAPALRAGALGCALHPVQACPDVDRALRRLPGSAWGVTCSPEAIPVARAVVDACGGRAYEVAEAARPVWQAAAVTASNGLASLLWTAETMLRSVGFGDPAAVLGPLVAGTLANLEGGVVPSSLTGPAVRADLRTLSLHRSSLAAVDPGLEEAYRVVAALLVATAQGAGLVDRPAAARMRAALDR